MGALEILFEMQRKRSNEKIARRKICISTHKTCIFSFFFSLDPSYFQSFLLSHFLFNLNNLKCYRSATLSLTNHLWALIATYKECFECLETNFVTIDDLFFWVLDLSTLGAHNFRNSHLFLMIFSALNAPIGIGGIQVLFRHQKQPSPPLGSGLPWMLECSLINRSILMETQTSVGQFFGFFKAPAACSGYLNWHWIKEPPNTDHLRN
jgi:hypothetical protein